MSRTTTVFVGMLVASSTFGGARLGAQQVTMRQASEAARLTARIDAFEESNEQLKQQVAALEAGLEQIGAVERGAPSEGLLGAEGQATRATVAEKNQFRFDVLEVMAPHLEQIEELVAAYRDHRHFVMRRSARGFANQATLGNCPDCLIPYVSVENQGKVSELYTDPPAEWMSSDQSED